MRRSGKKAAARKCFQIEIYSQTAVIFRKRAWRAFIFRLAIISMTPLLSFTFYFLDHTFVAAFKFRAHLYAMLWEKRATVEAKAVNTLKVNLQNLQDFLFK